MDETVRVPKQKRAVKKKEKIIDAGFELICKHGYYKTNTSEIAKRAGVSTGIIYQYFKDKHDIFLDGLKKYGDEIFFPMLKIKDTIINTDNFEEIMKSMITQYIDNHKLSKLAHEEITAMVHSDSTVAHYFYQRELETTESIKQFFLHNNFRDNNLSEKIHVMIGMIDNLCHEVIYHQHKSMNYDVMADIVIKNVKSLFKDDLL